MENSDFCPQNADNPQNKQRLLPQTAIDHYNGEMFFSGRD
jgi:hypothetical protein